VRARVSARRPQGSKARWPSSTALAARANVCARRGVGGRRKAADKGGEIDGPIIKTSIRRGSIGRVRDERCVCVGAERVSGPRTGRRRPRPNVVGDPAFIILSLIDGIAREILSPG
jgi:hypothetical protein